VNRTIVAFERDDAGEWVATLDCFHRRHVRHQPPLRPAPWVLDDEERARRVGTPLDCRSCDVAEVPEDLVVVRTTETWDERTMPAGLRRAHRVAAGRWARLHVVAGELRFTLATDAAIDRIVGAGEIQAIPPEVDHAVEPRGQVRFFVEFLGRN
jgi:tellurite resistance-related uncharacterized protein